MSLGSDASNDDDNNDDAAGPPPSAKRARVDQAGPESLKIRFANKLDDDSEWQARLQEESGAELRGGDEEDWDRCRLGH